MNKQRRKVRSTTKVDLDEILPEYNFSRARPNNYAPRYASHGKASEPTTKVQENDPIDAEAIFTLGFNDEKARQAFSDEMGNLTGLQ